VLAIVLAVPGHAPVAQAQAQARPNILLIVTDDQRADTMTALPSVKRRIGDKGIRFRSGYVPHALCCPSRASILTGNYSHTTGVWRNDSEFGYQRFDESSTLATWLDAGGYRTGLFGKYINHWADADPTHVPPGWDRWFAFTENCCSFYDFTASVDGSPKHFDETVYSALESAQRAANFIRAKDTEPLFVLWAPDAPHSPATPERRYAGAFAGLEPLRPPNYLEEDISDKPRWLRRFEIWGREKRQRVDALRQRMFESLLSVDDGVDLLLNALTDTGRLADTLVIFTSDNGILLGEHRGQGKPFPWRATHRVPFLVRFDRLIAEARGLPKPVLTIDIAPTIVDVAGVAAPPMDGKSLVPILSGERESVRSRFVIEAAAGQTPAYCGTRTRFTMFVRYATGAEEFYDYREDRWELQNAASLRAYRTRVAAHRRFAREHCSPRPPEFSWWSADA
jgi:arylsulfatase A-like enzyme